MLPNKRSPQNEELTLHNDEQPPFAATREKPVCPAKTQHSQKRMKKENRQNQSVGLVVRIAASFGGARESNEGWKSWSAFGPGGGYTGVDECENSWSCTPKTFAFNICHI